MSVEFDRSPSEEPIFPGLFIVDTYRFKNRASTLALNPDEYSLEKLFELTNNSFFRDEKPRPTPEQAEQLYTLSRDTVLGMCMHHGIDVDIIKEEHVLSFKVGNVTDFSDVTFHVFPACPDFSGGDADEPAFVSVEFSHDVATIHAALTVGECSPMLHGISITSKKDRVYDSYEEIAYITALLERLSQNAALGILDFCGGDGCVYPVEYSLQPPVPDETVFGYRLADFIALRA